MCKKWKKTNKNKTVLNIQWSNFQPGLPHYSSKLIRIPRKNKDIFTCTESGMTELFICICYMYLLNHNWVLETEDYKYQLSPNSSGKTRLHFLAVFEGAFEMGLQTTELGQRDRQNKSLCECISLGVKIGKFLKLQDVSGLLLSTTARCDLPSQASLLSLLGD